MATSDQSQGDSLERIMECAEGVVVSIPDEYFYLNNQDHTLRFSHHDKFCPVVLENDGTQRTVNIRTSILYALADDVLPQRPEYIPMRELIRVRCSEDRWSYMEKRFPDGSEEGTLTVALKNARCVPDGVINGITVTCVETVRGNESTFQYSRTWSQQRAAANDQGHQE